MCQARCHAADLASLQPWHAWEIPSIDDVLRPFQMRSKIAGIVDFASRGFVWHRARRNEILAADRIRRHAELARGCIDKTLHNIRRFGASCAAISIDWHGVGEDCPHAAMKRLEIVKSRQHARAAIWNIGTEGGQIRAHVRHQINVHSQKLAILGKRHARGGDIVAPLRIADKMIAPLGNPFHRLAQLARRNRGQGILAVRKQFCAKTTAHIRAYDSHFLESGFSERSGTKYRAGDDCPGCQPSTSDGRAWHRTHKPPRAFPCSWSRCAD